MCICGLLGGGVQVLRSMFDTLLSISAAPSQLVTVALSHSAVLATGMLSLVVACAEVELELSRSMAR
jgi:hypothetical protein